MDLAGAVPSSFEPLLGSVFTATLPEDHVTELVLAEVGRPPGDADDRPFQLLFRGGPASPGSQGIVHLEHEAAGPLDLFLVPAAPDAEGPCHVAVFA